MKKILITGSNGFIGQHLVERLQGLVDIVELKNDLRDHQAIADEVINCNPDMVVHLAARTEVEQSFYEQTTFSDINYTGTVNLIESMIRCKNKPKLVFASTMEVYGWQPVSDEIKNGAKFDRLPAFDPDNTACHPNAPYAVAKYACEKYIEYAHRSLGLDYVIIRQTNSYGRTENNFFVTEQIITQMLANPTDCYLGYKEPYRNFIFVDDLIDAWTTIIEKFDMVANNVFTLGPDAPIQIVEYANLIAKKLDWKGQIHWDSKPARPGEIYLLNSSSEKLTRMTGWKPTVSLSEGIDRTIEIWRSKVKC